MQMYSGPPCLQAILPRETISSGQAEGAVFLKRRDFMKIGGAAIAHAGAATLLAQAPQMQMGAGAATE